MEPLYPPGYNNARHVFVASWYLSENTNLCGFIFNIHNESLFRVFSVVKLKLTILQQNYGIKKGLGDEIGFRFFLDENHFGVILHFCLLSESYLFLEETKNYNFENIISWLFDQKNYINFIAISSISISCI